MNKAATPAETMMQVLHGEPVPPRPVPPSPTMATSGGRSVLRTAVWLGVALAAYRLGDGTAKLFGRLNLNPINHFDPLGGTLLAVTVIGGGDTAAA